MSECANIDVQDLLPEYVAENLSARERIEVEVHLSACASCRDDVRVLQAVQRARPVAPAVDIAAIVAALPGPVAAAPAETPGRGLRVVTGTPEPRRPMAPSMQAAGRRAATRPSGSRSSWLTGAGFRAAAALTLVALGGLSVSIARRGQMAITEGDALGSVVLSDAPMVIADAPIPYDEGVAPIVPVVAVAPSVLPVQELSDYTEEELALLLEHLDAWDGALSVDVVEPPVSRQPNDSVRDGGAS
jgi:hypothetical protein